MKALAILTLATMVVKTYSCETPTFINSKIEAFFDLAAHPDGTSLISLTGCITSTTLLRDALEIVVSDQKLPTLQKDAVKNLQRLRILKVKNSGVKLIKPGAFQDLPKISTINLASNNLKEIPEGVFNNMKVKKLLLNDNSISYIAPRAFDNMTNLNRIDLDFNRLQEWNGDWFGNTPNLYFISATFNEITTLPKDAFKNIRGRHAQPGKIPVTTSIFLSNNKIETIHPDAFRELKHLEFLDLDQNNIASLEDDVFADFRTIKYLMMAGNKIACLADELLDLLPLTNSIAMDENPLNCECLKDMQKWAEKHYATIMADIRSIECMQKKIREVLGSV